MAGLKFTPTADSTSAGGFTVQASLLNIDAGLGGNVVTANIAVNGPPVVTASATTLSYFDRQGPAAIDPALTVSDSDSPTLAGATVTLIGYVASEDLLGFTNQNGIAGTWNATTGVLTLSGAATPAQYQAALESVTYTDSNPAPSATSRIARFVVNDGALDSTPADRSINLTPPVPQLIADNGLVTDANVVATIPSAALAAADVGPSPDQLTFTVTSAPALGTVKVAGRAAAAGGTFTQSDIEQGRLTYTPAAPKTADDSFTFVVTDADGVALPAAVFQIHAVQTVVTRRRRSTSRRPQRRRGASNPDLADTGAGADCYSAGRSGHDLGRGYKLGPGYSRREWRRTHLLRTIRAGGKRDRPARRAACGPGGKPRRRLRDAPVLPHAAAGQAARRPCAESCGAARDGQARCLHR